MGSFVCGDNTMPGIGLTVKTKCNSSPNYHLFERYENYVLTGWWQCILVAGMELGGV